jgi:hypothetical protein
MKTKCVMMPDMGNREVTAQLRADSLFRGAPIVSIAAIVSTGKTDDHENVSGDKTFLAKPLDIGELKKTLENHIRRRIMPTAHTLPAIIPRPLLADAKPQFLLHDATKSVRPPSEGREAAGPEAPAIVPAADPVADAHSLWHCAQASLMAQSLFEQRVWFVLAVSSVVAILCALYGFGWAG